MSNNNEQERQDENTSGQSNQSSAHDSRDTLTPSFGVGGEVSRLDPQFRLPASTPTSLFEPSPGLFGSSFNQDSSTISSQQQQQQHSGSNIYSSSNLFVTTPTTTSSGSLFTRPHIPSSTPPSVKDGVPQLSFTMTSNATSFSDLAKKCAPPPSVAPLQTISTASMLQEYGPVSSAPPPPPGNCRRPTDSYNTTNQVSSSTSIYIVTTASSSFVTNTTTSANTPYIPPTSRLTRELAEKVSNVSQSDPPVYSPPQSPPMNKTVSLEKSAGQAALESAKNSQSSSSSRIPRKNPSTKRSTADRYEKFDLISLQTEYGEQESNKHYIVRKIQQLEKEISDMMRNSQGRNIELDPQFTKLKKMKKDYEVQLFSTKENMQKLSDVAYSKYNVRPTPRSPPRTNPIKPRMSTGPSPREGRRPKGTPHGIDPEVKDLLLDLDDTRCWCEDCDIHFDKIEEYCEHLHSTLHERAAKSKKFPWRVIRESIDKRKTYDRIKSMCANVSNKTKRPFDKTHLDRLLDPNQGKDGEKFRERSLARERGKFESGDMLFAMRGFNYLVPIEGFYCKLCNRTLCDYFDVDQHFKSLEHNYKHTECLALDPDWERKFRNKMLQSYKKQYADNDEEEEVEVDVEREDKSRRGSSSSPTRKSRESRRAKEQALYAPAPQYKKPTSHIVDEHETVTEKFAKKNGTGNKNNTFIKTTTRRSNKRHLSDDEVESTPRSKSVSPAKPSYKRPLKTGIVPLAETRKPSALKRLRTGTTATTTAATRTSTKDKQKKDDDDEENDDDEVTAVAHIPRRSASPEPMYTSDNDDRQVIIDEDSPFPYLELKIHGNYHASLLRDPRLAKPCHVLLKPLVFEDLQVELNDSASLWTRVHKMVAKKEKDREELNKRMAEKDITEAVYFDKDDQPKHIEIADDDDEEEDQDEKKRVTSETKVKEIEKKKSDLEKTHSDEEDGTPSLGNGDKKSPKKDEKKDTRLGFESDGAGETGDEPSKRPDIDMAFIEDFLCEK